MSPLLKSTELTGTDQTCFTHPGLDRRTGQLAIYTRPVTPRNGAISRSWQTFNPLTRWLFLIPDCNFGRDDDRGLLPGI